MSKAGMRPSWVISDLMEVIGLGELRFCNARTDKLDKETVETMIAPDLDNYTQETRLRSHLQVSHIPADIEAVIGLVVCDLEIELG
jgi:hypothetical protein